MSAQPEFPLVLRRPVATSIGRGPTTSSAQPEPEQATTRLTPIAGKRTLRETRAHRRVAVVRLKPVLLSVAMALGCGRESGRPSGPTPFGEHRPLTAATATKATGLEANIFGGSECLSGLAIHTKPAPRDGWFCTHLCSGSKANPCPSGWSCAELPTLEFRICLPPPSWTSRNAFRVVDAGELTP